LETFVLPVDTLSDLAVSEQTNPAKNSPTLPSGKVLIIRTVRPIEYYLSMLGIYMHHLFFANSSGEQGDTGALPAMVWMIEQARCSGFLVSPIIGKNKDNWWLIDDDLSKPVAVKPPDFHTVQKRIAKLYLWLTCKDFLNHGDWSTIFPAEAGNHAISTFKGYLELLRNAIGNLVGLPGRELDAPSEEPILDKINLNLQITGRSNLDSVLRDLVGDRLSFGRKSIF
jgi:hypothetical protein